ncbi:MAG: 30S ribosomal protein S6, partial [Spirochaetales bacterium]|nr:30S ribosomal protein S6 [Spirochaetales bacterium]
MSEFSRKYEMMIIYDEEEKSLDEIKTFVNGVFSANGMTVIDEKDIGLRDYAYPINEKTRGHYYLYHFESEPD